MRLITFDFGASAAEHLSDATEDATKGIEAWLTSFGWDVEVIDLRGN